ncbi:unnamed protein product [Tilletia controversa]|uniref:Uncharacterized protein n=1 Tax=Tilletia controversa TaxID=13291 RepID=A0A8X7MX94_9BASI|nr:hypothetical protein A4X06_0g1984 [Tilletia controversa]CAD6901235.1 unnamed protein product [Tilletia controversa]CAD6948311.1 unnamed protein product [Tilletia controversa]
MPRVKLPYKATGPSRAASEAGSTVAHPFDGDELRAATGRANLRPKDLSDDESLDEYSTFPDVLLVAKQYGLRNRFAHRLQENLEINLEERNRIRGRKGQEPLEAPPANEVEIIGTQLKQSQDSADMQHNVKVLLYNVQVLTNTVETLCRAIKDLTGKTKNTLSSSAIKNVKKTTSKIFFNPANKNYTDATAIWTVVRRIYTREPSGLGEHGQHIMNEKYNEAGRDAVRDVVGRQMNDIRYQMKGMLWGSIQKRKTLREFAEEVCERYGAVLSYGLLLRLAMMRHLARGDRIPLRKKQANDSWGPLDPNWFDRFEAEVQRLVDDTHSNDPRRKADALAAFKRYINADVREFGSCDTLSTNPAPNEEVQCTADIEAVRDEFELPATNGHPSFISTASSSPTPAGGKRKRPGSVAESSSDSDASTELSLPDIPQQAQEREQIYIPSRPNASSQGATQPSGPSPSQQASQQPSLNNRHGLQSLPLSQQKFQQPSRNNQHGRPSLALLSQQTNVPHSEGSSAPARRSVSQGTKARHTERSSTPARRSPRKQLAPEALAEDERLKPALLGDEEFENSAYVAPTK